MWIHDIKIDIDKDTNVTFDYGVTKYGFLEIMLGGYHDIIGALDIQTVVFMSFWYRDVTHRKTMDAKAIASRIRAEKAKHEHWDLELWIEIASVKIWADVSAYFEGIIEDAQDDAYHGGLRSEPSEPEYRLIY